MSVQLASANGSPPVLVPHAADQRAGIVHGTSQLHPTLHEPLKIVLGEPVR